MKHTDEEGITWLRRGYCDVEGIIQFDPSEICRFRRFSVYNKNGVCLGTVDALTKEDVKALEKVDGKFVRFRSYPPTETKNDRIFYLYL